MSLCSHNYLFSTFILKKNIWKLVPILNSFPSLYLKNIIQKLEKHSSTSI